MNKREIKRQAYAYAFSAVQSLIYAVGIWDDVDQNTPEYEALIAGMDEIAQMLFERSNHVDRKPVSR